MTMKITSSFKVDGIWYDMDASTLYHIEDLLARHEGIKRPTNRAIIRYVHANLPQFSMIEADDGLHIWVSRR